MYTERKREREYYIYIYVYIYIGKYIYIYICIYIILNRFQGARWAGDVIPWRFERWTKGCLQKYIITFITFIAHAKLRMLWLVFLAQAIHRLEGHACITTPPKCRMPESDYEKRTHVPTFCPNVESLALRRKPRSWARHMGESDAIAVTWRTAAPQFWFAEFGSRADLHQPRASDLTAERWYLE